MWKAAFSGRSETGSVSGRPSSQKKKSSGSVVSTTSRDERRKSGKSSRGSTYDDYEDHDGAYVTTPSSRTGEPRGLTESAVNALNKDDDLDWEDEDKDARSERRSVKSGKSGRSERHRRKSERSRSRSREKARKEEKRKSGRRESDRGKSGRDEVYERKEGERALPDMGSFEQFPGQYAGGMMGQAGQPDHMMSGGASGLPSAPDQQFGPTREDSFGAAAGYYLDEGQSVQHQPGVRKASPNMLVNPEHHLHAASLEANPAEDTGQGSAADFFTGDIPLTEEPQPINKPGKKPVTSSSSSSKPSKPGRTSSLGTAAAATAALGAAAVAGSSSYSGAQHSNSYQQAQYSGSRPGRKGSEQVSPGSTTPQYPPSRQGQGVNGSYYGRASGQGTPIKQGESASYYAAQPGQGTPTRPATNGSYYAAPSGRQSEGKAGKHSSQNSNAGVYAAGAAAAGLAGYAAHEAHQSNQQKYSSSQYTTTQYPGYAQSAAYTSGSYSGMQQQPFHEHKGPITKIKDGFLNLLSTEEDVVKMEMYTEAIGVCKYCFDPRTSPWDAPRRHHYHKHSPRRDSFEDLRRRRSLDKMRRHGSREQLDGRVDKDSRYYASDSKRKSGKADLAAAGLAGVGLAAGANALFNSGKDFEDTYSVKSGHRAGSAGRRRSRSSSREQRRKSTHGVIGRDSKEDYVFVKTKDGRTEKRRVQRSRSRSNDARSNMMGTAAGAALGAAAIGAASSRRRHSRSRSRSSSPGLAGILGFSGSKQKRGRHSPNGSSYNVSGRPSREEQQSPGLFGGFFTSPPPKRRNSKREHRKKKAGFFNFGNGSSSSSDGEMAFGDGFSSKTNLPLRRQTSNRNVKRRGSDQRLAATIAGIGTTAAALAAAQKGHRVTKRTSRPELGAKRRHVAQQDPSDEEWEDELPSDSSSGSSLAFGDYDNKLSRRQSKESMTSNGSGAGGLGAWGWRWGGKKDKKKRLVPSPPPAYPPRPDASIIAPAAAAAGVAAVSARDANRPAYDSRGSSMSGAPPGPMQFVDPKPVSEDSSVHGSNRISMPGSFDFDEPPIIRPGPSPIQQPQPIAPIQPAFTDRHDDGFDRPKPRRTMSSPIQNSFGMKDAAMIGAAAIGTASIIASQSGRRSKEPKDVRFGLTDEQQAKEDREKRRDREKTERNERARADRERALKEEAERHTREQDVLRRREEENRRIAEAKVEREREAERAREAEREKKEKDAQELRERDRQESQRREESRKAEELQRQDEARRRREAEIDAQIEAKRRELEEEQARSQRRRDSQSDKKSERSSSIPWGAVAAGTAAAATAGAVYAGVEHEREKDRDDKQRDSYTAREIRPGQTSSELADQDIFDPALFKRKRSPNRSPSGDRQIEEIARKAYEKIRDEDVDYDQMIAERDEYYHEPQRSQVDVFAPKEILDRKPGYKEHAPDPMADNDVRYVRDAQGHVFDDELYGPKSFERSKHAPYGVPRLGLVAPTPPPDPKAKERRRRDRSPLSKSEVAAAPEKEAQDDERDTRSEPGRRTRSRSITWGEPQTHVYEPRTPESFREGADGYIDAKDLAAAAAATAAAAAGGAAVYAASGEDEDERSSKERKDRRRRSQDAEEVVDIAGDEDSSYHKPFFESVSDLGFAVDSPGTEGAPPVPGFVEGEVDATPKGERRQHVPGGWDDDQKDGEYFDAGDVPASASRNLPLDKDTPTVVDEPAWEPPLSKKDKKKRDKASKRTSTFDEDELPTPPVAEPEPVIDPSAPVEEEIPYEMLSKKDKKKRDKAKRASMLEEDIPAPSVAEPETEPVTVQEPAPPAEDEIPYEFLSKKDKKKRDKLKRSMPEDIASPPPEPEPTQEATPAVEEEIPYEMLSKKDKKKRDKLKRSMSEDVAPSPSETEPETVVEAEPEPAWEPPLSKKEQKKREKEAKKNGFADVAAAAMTTAGIAAVAGAAATADDDSESWDSAPSKKAKKGKKAKAVERDIRDIEPTADSMPGGWEAEKTVDTPPEAVDPFQFQVPNDSPPATSPAVDTTKEVDPMDEFADVKSSKKSKKKAKRDSLRFNEPEVSSPLRSEVPLNDYIGAQQAGAEPYTNGNAEVSKLPDEPLVEERTSRSEKYEVDDRPLTESPRRISPDDARSVASEPTGARERRRRSKGDYRASEYYEEGETDPYDDVRSVAASEPADIHERRKSKRRSRAEDDDTMSVVSSRSRRDKEDDAKKEKKGGFFGLFGKKSSSPPANKSDGALLSRTSTRDSKDGYEEDGERRRRRRKSEYGDDDDDTRSVTSESRHRHHHRRRTDEDYPRSDSGSRHHHRRRTDDDYFGDDSNKDRDQSFLGMRVEDMPPLPASRPAPSLSAALDKSEGQGLGTPDPAGKEVKDGFGECDAAQQRVFQGPGETVQAVEFVRDAEREKALRSLSGEFEEVVERKQPTPGMVAARETKVPDVEEAVEYLPALPESPPGSPTEFRATQTPHRPTPLQRPTSTTAVPLRFPFGQSPSTPGQGRMERAVSFGGHLPSSPSTPHYPSHKSRQGRPTSTEMMPLYLVERTRKPAEVETELPSLPSSKPSSRASSIVGSDEYESAVEEFSSPVRERAWQQGLTIDTDSANAGFAAAGEDYLDSQQTTPRATERPSDPFATAKAPKQQPEYWTWQDLQREQEQAEALARGEKPQPQFYTWEDYERDEALHRRALDDGEDLPELPPSRPESRTERRSGSGNGDLAKGVAAAALAGGAAVLGYNALKDRDDEDAQQKRDLAAEPVSEESGTPSSTATASKKKKKGKKGKKQQALEDASEEPKGINQPPVVPAGLPRRDTDTFVEAEKTMEEGDAAGRIPADTFFSPAKPNELDRFLETEERVEAGAVTGEPAAEEPVADVVPAVATSRDVETSVSRTMHDAPMSSPTDAEFVEAEQHAAVNEPRPEPVTEQPEDSHVGSLAGVATASAVAAVGAAGVTSMLGDESSQVVEDETMASEPTSHHRSVSGASAHSQPALPHLEKHVSPGHEEDMVAVPAPVEASTSIDTEARPEAEFAPLLSRKQSKKAKKQAKKGGAKTAMDALMATDTAGEDSETAASRAAATEPSLTETTAQPAVEEDTAAPSMGVGELVQPDATSGDAMSTLANLAQPAQEAASTQAEPEEEWEIRPSVSRKQSKKAKKKQKQRLDVFGEDEPQQPVEGTQAAEAAAAAAGAAISAEPLFGGLSEASPQDIPLPQVDDVELDEDTIQVTRGLSLEEHSQNVAGETEPASVIVEDTSADLPLTPATRVDEEFTATAAEDTRPIEGIQAAQPETIVPAIDRSTGVEDEQNRSLDAAPAETSSFDDRNATAFGDEAAGNTVVSQETISAAPVETISAEAAEPAQTSAPEPEDEFAWSTGSKKKAKKGKKGKKAASQAFAWDEEPATGTDNQPIGELDGESEAQTSLSAAETPADGSRSLDAFADEATPLPESQRDLQEQREPMQEPAEPVDPRALDREVVVPASLNDPETSAAASKDAPASEKATTAADDENAEDIWAFTSSKKKKGKKGKNAAAATLLDEPAIETHAEPEAGSMAAATESNVPHSIPEIDPAESGETPAVEVEDFWAPATSSKKKKKGKKGVSSGLATPAVEEEPGVPTQDAATADPVQDVSNEADAAFVDAATEVQDDTPAAAEMEEFWAAPSKKKKKGKKGANSGLVTPVAEEEPMVQTSRNTTHDVTQEIPADADATFVDAHEDVPVTARDDNFWTAPSKTKKKGKKAQKAAFDELPVEDESTPLEKAENADVDVTGRTIEDSLATEDQPRPSTISEDLGVATQDLAATAAEHPELAARNVLNIEQESSQPPQEADDFWDPIQTKKKKGKKGKKSGLQTPVEEERGFETPSMVAVASAPADQIQESGTAEAVTAAPAETEKPSELMTQDPVISKPAVSMVDTDESQHAYEELASTVPLPADDAEEAAMSTDPVEPIPMDTERSIAAADVAEDFSVTAAPVDEDEWAPPAKKKKGKKGKRAGAEAEAEVVSEEPVQYEPPVDPSHGDAVVDSSSVPLPQDADPAEEDFWAPTTTKKKKKGKKSKLVEAETEPAPASFDEPAYRDIADSVDAPQEAPIVAATDEPSIPISADNVEGEHSFAPEQLESVSTEQTGAALDILPDAPNATLEERSVQLDESLGQEERPVQETPMTEQDDFWSAPSKKKGKKGKRSRQLSEVDAANTNEISTDGAAADDIEVAAETVMLDTEPTPQADDDFWAAPTKKKKGKKGKKSGTQTPIALEEPADIARETPLDTIAGPGDEDQRMPRESEPAEHAVSTEIPIESAVNADAVVHDIPVATDAVETSVMDVETQDERHNELAEPSVDHDESVQNARSADEEVFGPTTDDITQQPAGDNEMQTTAAAPDVDVDASASAPRSLEEEPTQPNADPEADFLWAPTTKKKKKGKKGKQATTDAMEDQEDGLVTPQEAVSIAQEVNPVIETTDSPAVTVEPSQSGDAVADDDSFWSSTTSKGKKGKKGKKSKRATLDWEDPPAVPEAPALESTSAIEAEKVNDAPTSIEAAAEPTALSGELTADREMVDAPALPVAAARDVDAVARALADDEMNDIADKSLTTPTTTEGVAPVQTVALSEADSQALQDPAEGVSDRLDDVDRSNVVPLDTVQEDTVMPEAETEPPQTIHEAIGTVDEPVEDTNFAYTTKKSKKDKKKAKKATRAQSTDDWAEEPQQATESAPREESIILEPTAAAVAAGALGLGVVAASNMDSSAEKTTDQGEEEWPSFSTKKSKKDKRKAKKGEDLPSTTAIEPDASQATAKTNKIDPTQEDHTVSGNDAESAASASKEMASPEALLDPQPDTIAFDEQLATRGSTTEEPTSYNDTADNDAIERGTQIPASLERPATPTEANDIDFAATIAAGLQESGFDPNMVVEDPVFHRRTTPPNATGEADPEEIFEGFSKTKKKKGKRGKAAEATSDETSRDISGNQTPQAATTDFDEVLAQSLAGTGIDPSALEQAGSAKDLEGDPEAFSFATTRRKKGKKKAQAADQDPLPTADAPGDVPDEDSAAQVDQPDVVDDPSASMAAEKSENNPVDADRGRELPPAPLADLSRQLTIDTNTTEPTSALTTTPGTPLLDPAADLVHAGERDMDVDDMDKAYRVYKRNKRKQKKQKWAAAQGAESTSETPLTVEETNPFAEASQQEASREATEAIAGQSKFEDVEQNDFVAPAESTSTNVPEQFSGQSGLPQGSPLEYMHTSEVSQSLPKAFERTPSPPVERSAVDESEQDARSRSSLRSGAEAAGLGAAVVAGVAGAGSLLNRSSSRHRDSSTHSPRLESQRSLGLLPQDNQSSWSFDGVHEGKTEYQSSTLPGTDREVVRDSGYQEGSPRLSRESAGSSSRALPSMRPAQSKESLHSRRSNEALYISTDTGPEWDLKPAKKRGTNTANSEESRTLHARTPSENAQNTPLESTSRNRASYLFQTTPENLRGVAFDNEATPVQERSYFANDAVEQPSDRAQSFSNPERAAFSPPPGVMSPHLPLDTIHEENLGHKRSVGETADAPGPDHKAVRRTETPQSIRARERALSPTGLPPLQTTSNAGRSVSNPGVDELARTADMRSPSVMSNRSNFSGNQWKSPDELRSYSRASNRSNTPSLRRTSLSGDLRAASRRGDSGSAVGARSSPKTIPFEAPPTPPSNDDEVMDAGASRSAGMSDVFQGYGDAQGSQVSPTRPPSMRKRQSMHIMDLESRLEQLAAENQALQSAKQDNVSSRGVDDQSEGTLRARDLELQQKDNEINQIRAMLQPMQDEIARLTEMNNGLTEANRNLVDESNNRVRALQQEHAEAHEQWQTASRELDGLKEEHGQLTSGLRAAVEAQLATALASKNSEIRELREELDVATEKIRALQVQISATKGRDFLTVRDEDYFDGACQKLCQHVQQWVLRFSKVSDKHICRLSTDIKDDKIEARLDNAILDGSDVDKLLGDRVRRRDVFMSVVMTMVWEYVFTRYLFGMDREQRQKLKALEKLLSEVGPPRAVAQWRATTLTLLAKRPAFAEQRDRDEEAVMNEVFDLLCVLLPPPSADKAQMRASLLKVIHIAVDLSIEMRTQRSEYIMLPPLLPEYDTNGDLMHKVHFNASLMNERSGMFSSNEELEQTRAVVKVVLFPLVVKKGDESGEGEEEIVVCPAQVLVHNDNGRGKKVVRVESGHMTIDDPRRSRQSLMSAAGSNAF